MGYDRVGVWKGQGLDNAFLPGIRWVVMQVQGRAALDSPEEQSVQMVWLS